MSKLGALHITKHSGAKQTATVIFFHGSGTFQVSKLPFNQIFLNKTFKNEMIWTFGCKFLFTVN